MASPPKPSIWPFGAPLTSTLPHIPLTQRTDNYTLGKLCGALFLDRGFDRLVQGKAGTDVWSAMAVEDKARLLNDDWEHGIKSQFDQKMRSWTINVNLGHDEQRRLNFPPSRLKLTR